MSGLNGGCCIKSHSHCVTLMRNHLPSELVSSFFVNGITNFDQHVAVHCFVDGLSAFQ
ncbi:hypothetical protein NPIL_691481, partial [Nephila pilipes]